MHLERRSREMKGGEHPFSSLPWKHVGESTAFLEELLEELIQSGLTKYFLVNLIEFF